MFERTEQTTIEPLLLTARQAAKVLNVCEKTLWTLTKNGDIPAVRIGRAVRYDPADLRAWIERAKSAKASLDNCAPQM
jgi:excisionase family DNA binding protein